MAATRMRRRMTGLSTEIPGQDGLASDDAGPGTTIASPSAERSARAGGRRLRSGFQHRDVASLQESPKSAVEGDQMLVLIEHDGGDPRVRDVVPLQAVRLAQALHDRPLLADQ